MHVKWIAALAAAGIVGGIATLARADDQPPSTAIKGPWDSQVTGHVDTGIVVNTADPANHVNFGQLFTDQDDQIRVNQAMVNWERDLDPKNAGYQWGFKFTGMYGTDSRITHFYGELDRVTGSPYQWDVVEADGQAHLPWWLGGTDVKIGQYPTPLGAEVIDATGNTFFTHSYIFNFGLPFKHTGILTTTHVNDMIDIWFGLDTGSNNSLFDKGMPNHEFPKVLSGFGLNGLLGGNLTILGLSHIGPEQARFVEQCAPCTNNPQADNIVRQFYDVVATYKINDSWSTTTEFNYTRDDMGLRNFGGPSHATAEGIASYLTYAASDQWSISLRGEIYRDDQGFFVFAPSTALDTVNLARGLAPATPFNACTGQVVPATNAGSACKNTYGEVTLGASFKPSNSMGYLTLRPELRYDTSWGGNFKPFGLNSKGVGTQNDQFTIGMDLILGF